jgi:cytochrome c oxidase subunit II
VSTFDNLFNWYFYIGFVAAIVVIAMLVVFGLKWRASPGKAFRPHDGHESWKIVLLTVLISLSLLTAVEYQTFASFSNIETPDPPSAVTINVVAFQWGWNFTYPNGAYSLNNLTVPAGTDVILNITSRDVFHSLGIASLAVKEDAVPGKYNSLWFNVPNPGVTMDAIRCYELCGVGHACMLGNLTVISETNWTTLMNSGQSAFESSSGGCPA